MRLVRLFIAATALCLCWAAAGTLATTPHPTDKQEMINLLQYVISLPRSLNMMQDIFIFCEFSISFNNFALHAQKDQNSARLTTKFLFSGRAGAGPRFGISQILITCVIHGQVQ
jgi:hypothetical protein